MLVNRLGGKLGGGGIGGRLSWRGGWGRRLSGSRIFRTSGQISAVEITTKIVPIPPPTTEIIGPKYWAVRPDSQPPSSLLAPIKILLTAETRPRMLSGVRTWTNVWRTTTLMASKAAGEEEQLAATESWQKEWERPKIMVATPKAATARRRFRPARFIGGRWATINAITTAPTAGAARIQPKPTEPTCKMSVAKMGSSDVAPPSRTAKRSSEMMARMMRVLRDELDAGGESFPAFGVAAFLTIGCSVRPEKNDHKAGGEDAIAG